MPQQELDLFKVFRNPKHIKALAKLIKKESKNKIRVMEVCGGHTHTIMKYGIPQILPESIEFVHGPGCPVCIMPKERIDHAYILSLQPDVIMVTLGDMIKVPGSHGSLSEARSKGADVHFVYSPLDVLKIAKENPEKKIIFFAIGFETTTPMTAPLVGKVIKLGLKNVLFHINHVITPEVMQELLNSRDEHVDSYNNRIDAFIGPSHVSVITGSKVFDRFPKEHKKPVVVTGFEPVDVMEGLLMIVRQVNEGRADLENQYKRSVSYEGNIVAQDLINRYFDRSKFFKWRGLGNIPKSGLKLRDEFAYLDAEKIYDDVLSKEEIEDHKLCICGDILRGMAKPTECQVFGTACKPSKPIGSCMVSSEGACAAYYKYGGVLND